MEDIEYLRKNACEESFLFVVDSSMRDMKAYRTPSEYTIDFASPFVNVIGLELLNATIPRTEYAIEEGKNTLAYAVTGNPLRFATVPPGDYNLVQLMEALNGLLLDGLQCKPHSTPFKKTSRTLFYAVLPFKIDMTKSTIAKTLGFYEPHVEVLSNSTGAVSSLAYYGPFPGFQTHAAPLQQRFIAGENGPVGRVLVQAEGAPLTIRILSADLQTVFAEGTSTPPNAEVLLGTINDPLVSGTTYVIDVVSTGSSELFVNTPRADTLDAEGLTDLSLCADVFVDKSYHELTSPGLVDLTGERHVLIRCPEIESCIHLERVHEQFHAGLGMVRLGVDGYQDQRTEFVSFPRKRLSAPLGKLTKLSFRLEKPNGKLYNARGVDHVLVLAIHYYKGVCRVGGPGTGGPYSLNPDYTPELLTFLDKKWSQEITYREDQAKSMYR